MRINHNWCIKLVRLVIYSIECEKVHVLVFINYTIVMLLSAGTFNGRLRILQQY